MAASDSKAPLFENLADRFIQSNTDASETVLQGINTNDVWSEGITSYYSFPLSNDLGILDPTYLRFPRLEKTGSNRSLEI
jgi:hypothetical protein